MSSASSPSKTPRLSPGTNLRPLEVFSTMERHRQTASAKSFPHKTCRSRRYHGIPPTAPTSRPICEERSTDPHIPLVHRPRDWPLASWTRRKRRDQRLMADHCPSSRWVRIQQLETGTLERACGKGRGKTYSVIVGRQVHRYPGEGAPVRTEVCATFKHFVLRSDNAT
jgi:hypothetical protein